MSTFSRTQDARLGRAKFSYDVLGNRVEKDVDANGDGVFESITKFAYDLNGNAWADLTSGGSLTTRRVYEDAVDKLFARIGASNNPAFYLTDLLGSVRDIVSGPGSLIDNLSYDSYGTVTTETSPSNGDRYAWTSRERDSEINLQYNRARYYDPATGRWISQDPLGFDAGDGNLYRYVMNQPIGSLDPTGKSEEDLNSIFAGATAHLTRSPDLATPQDRAYASCDYLWRKEGTLKAFRHLLGIEIPKTLLLGVLKGGYFGSFLEKVGEKIEKLEDLLKYKDKTLDELHEALGKVETKTIYLKDSDADGNVARTGAVAFLFPETHRFLVIFFGEVGKKVKGGAWWSNFTYEPPMEKYTVIATGIYKGQGAIDHEGVKTQYLAGWPTGAFPGLGFESPPPGVDKAPPVQPPVPLPSEPPPPLRWPVQKGPPQQIWRWPVQRGEPTPIYRHY